MSARTLAQDRQECLDAGCDDYMSKPMMDRKNLTAMVAKHMDSRCSLRELTARAS